MAIRPRNRFEVFKRDGFRCQYCGRPVPEVTLEVDHIIPKAEGGKDSKDNLITACFECNRGKGPESLGDSGPPIDYAARIDETKERAKQLKSYRLWERKVTDEIDAAVNEAVTYWTEHCGGTGYNLAGALYRFVKALGLASVKDAMNIAAQNPRTKTFGYVIAVLNNRMKERE